MEDTVVILACRVCTYLVEGIVAHCEIVQFMSFISPDECTATVGECIVDNGYSMMSAGPEVYEVRTVGTVGDDIVPDTKNLYTRDSLAGVVIQSLGTVYVTSYNGNRINYWSSCLVLYNNGGGLIGDVQVVQSKRTTDFATKGKACNNRSLLATLGLTGKFQRSSYSISSYLVRSIAILESNGLFSGVDRSEEFLNRRNYEFRTSGIATGRLNGKGCNTSF